MTIKKMHTEAGHTFTEVVIEVFKLSGLLVAEGDKLSAPLGLTSARWKVMGALARAKEPLTVSQIARHMGLSRQAVQTLVNAMIRSGVVELTENPNHKRAKWVVLTTQGQSIYDQMEAIQIPWSDECASHISPEDLNTTLKTLKQLSELF